VQTLGVSWTVASARHIDFLLNIIIKPDSYVSLYHCFCQQVLVQTEYA